VLLALPELPALLVPQVSLVIKVLLILLPGKLVVKDLLALPALLALQGPLIVFVGQLVL
jgi:hypothetical protein